MKRLVALALTLAIYQPALAAPEDPVTAIMTLAAELWSDNPPEGKDYFDEQHISLFSSEFVTAYRAAQKYPIYDDGGTPFGYDVVTNSQDGCPLKDVSIVPGAQNAGTTDVKVTFKLMSCYTDDPARDATSEVHFKVVTENGRSVIADMDRIVEGKPMSLMAEMKDIVKSGETMPTQQPEPQQ